MKFLPELFERNRAWAGAKLAADPAYFDRLCAIHKPEHLWLGCSDSRVPANEIVGMEPGELFVHRNLANIVPLSDVNTMSVVEFAVENIGIRHIIVCGHYRCEGVRAALAGGLRGAPGLWLQQVRHVAEEAQAELAALTDPQARWDRLCELNVVAQVRNLASTHVIHQAWSRGAVLAIHGWIYDLRDGLIRDLDVTVGNAG
ncbi:carbonic anhydrase [Mesoterricola sediminis]|uniref:Carbonic anhydrase 2 n=1 Tax=Mesoterricola sediminis TaxID=2927980 RepID=A0AA48KBG6_9BACT|nr:carbonic anhydrase [Mesoterricola sediminis]BDU76084.1 carbonic anhydrase [Mesoterricola sediminis]